MSEITPAAYRAGSGEPLLLLHGFTGSWQLWQPILAELTARYDVFAPTLPGHFGGPPISIRRPFGLGQFTDWIERELDSRSIDKPHVVGSSLGGALAAELAVRGRARSLIAVAPGFGWTADDPVRGRIATNFRRQHRLGRR
ncbi:alpha/beta fold hydrolase, partial [Amycolatopsis sp. NPDC098790]|uniref:alpha/beta fold hydrolase n=1 Tax=Amycolatopsis sp. NPDC098790 TaxID=3363939 RepID=UPI003807E230